MTDASQTPQFPLKASLLVLLAIGVVLAIVAGVGLPAVGMQAMQAPALTAIGLCVTFGLIGLVPVWVMDRRMEHGAAFGFLAGMGIRLIGCAAGFFIFKSYMDGAELVFAYWTAGVYFVLLMVELWLVGQYVRQMQPAAGPELEAQGC